MVVHLFNPSTQEAEVSSSLSSRLAWSTEGVLDSQGHTEKPCLKKPPPTTTKKKKTVFVSVLFC